MTVKPSADIKKFVPQHYIEVMGKNLPALLAAVNTINAKTEDLIKSCVDQLFLSTASGRYLVRLGEQKGFTMPANSGLDIRAFRVLVPIMVSSPKQVRTTINDIVQAFYRAERLKPYVQSTRIGPYTIESGDDIIIETSDSIYTFSVLENQVTSLNGVTAKEIAAIINTAQTPVFAEAIRDRQTGNEFLRLYNLIMGAGSYIKVIGGRLQNVLLMEGFLPTSASAGTTWTVSKTAALGDEIKFKWNGLGVNPAIYLVKNNDFVTITGLADIGMVPFSRLNGSYKVIDSGYDYFVIRNQSYTTVSATLVQPADNNIIFTENKNYTIFDRSEYALSTETSSNTITITAPAVPPLAIRFLAGSAHLHGSELNVEDFTRAWIKVTLPSGEDKPSGNNQFLLSNQYHRYDFRKKRYKTINVDNHSSPTFQMDISDGNYSVLPYTTATVVGSSPIYGTIDSSEYRLNFPNYHHGLIYGWGFTLNAASGASNITLPMLNKEHIVKNVIDDHNLLFEIKDSSGAPVKFNGIAWGPADVYRQPSYQADGSDFYLEFPSSVALAASGLIPGMVFRLNTVGGTDIDPYYAGILRYRKLVVQSIIDTPSVHRITFSAGLEPGLTGAIITGVSGMRSGYFGGNTTYFFNKTSPHNQAKVMNGLKALFVEYLPSSNRLYVGSYIYDPQGKKTNFAVSKYVVGLSDNILKGDNIPYLLIDSVTDQFGDPLPQTGELVIGYGTDRLEGPIKYYAIVENPGSKQIFIDQAYRFQYSHPVGERVYIIRDRAPYKPRTAGEDYPVYLTGTTAGRNTMFELIKLLTASGIFIEKDVILPELRYADTSIKPFD